MTTAIIKTGGKQYRVAEGQVFRFEKLAVEPGDTVTFDQVLMVADGDNVQVGAPYIDGMTVSAEVLDQTRGKKVHIIKFRRRKHYMRKAGHRQYLTEVKITAIGKGGKAPAKKAAAKTPAKAEEKASEEKTAPKKTAAKPAAKTEKKTGDK